MKWPSANNDPIDANMTTAADESYISALGSNTYMMRAYFFMLPPSAAL